MRVVDCEGDVAELACIARTLDMTWSSNGRFEPCHRRWRGRGAKPSGLLSVTTTDALFARKVQRKLSNGVAGLAPAGSSLDRAENRGNSCHLSD